MCGSDGLSSSSSLLICGKSCRCQAENPLNALSSFPKPALPMEIRQEGLFVLDLLQRLCALQTGHLILSRSNSNHTQGRPRHLAFPPLPDLQKIKNYATVEYSEEAPRGLRRSRRRWCAGRPCCRRIEFGARQTQKASGLIGDIAKGDETSALADHVEEIAVFGRGGIGPMPVGAGTRFWSAKPDEHRAYCERRPPSSSGPAAARCTGNGGIPPRPRGRGASRNLPQHAGIMLRRRCQSSVRQQTIPNAQHNSRRNIIRSYVQLNIRPTPRPGNMATSSMSSARLAPSITSVTSQTRLDVSSTYLGPRLKISSTRAIRYHENYLRRSGYSAFAGRSAERWPKPICGVGASPTSTGWAPSDSTPLASIDRLWAPRPNEGPG